MEGKNKPKFVYDKDGGPMRKTILIALLALTLACQPVTKSLPPPTATPSPLPPETVTPTRSDAYLTPTPGYPDEGFGPSDFRSTSTR